MFPSSEHYVEADDVPDHCWNERVRHNLSPRKIQYVFRLRVKYQQRCHKVKRLCFRPLTTWAFGSIGKCVSLTSVTVVSFPNALRGRMCSSFGPKLIFNIIVINIGFNVGFQIFWYVFSLNLDGMSSRVLGCCRASSCKHCISVQTGAINEISKAYVP